MSDDPLLIHVWVVFFKIRLQKMSCCACLVKTFAWTLLLVAITYIGVKTWMAQKSYIFDADTLKAVTEEALENSKGEITEIVTVDRVGCRP